MAVAELRRWSDDILLCDVVVGFTRANRVTSAILNTITGNTQKQKLGVQQRFINLTLEFASDYENANIIHYENLVYEHHLDDILAPRFFKYTHMDGTEMKLRCLEIADPTDESTPMVEVFTVECQFKIDGYLP